MSVYRTMCMCMLQIWKGGDFFAYIVRIKNETPGLVYPRLIDWLTRYKNKMTRYRCIDILSFLFVLWWFLCKEYDHILFDILK